MADRYGTGATTAAPISIGRFGTGIIISAFAAIISASSTFTTWTSATGLWMRTRQNAGAWARANNWGINQWRFGTTSPWSMGMRMGCGSPAIAGRSNAIGHR